MSTQSGGPRFSSRFAFIIATAGSAIGLGNVWSFTYVAGINGGAGFILVYLLALAFIATPVFIAELLLGRMGRANPVTSLKILSAEAGSKLPWHWVAWVGLVATILVLSFYSVIAGQIMAYGYEALFGGMTDWSSEAIRAFDTEFKSDPTGPLIWSAIFCAITAFIVAAGVQGGIERASKLMMPALFLMLLGMVMYAAFSGGFARALDFLFGFNTLEFGPKLFLDAVGQAFFTIGVGVGGIMIMGSYMGRDVHLPKAAGIVVLMDLAVALLAGLAIFPLLFASDMDPAVGPGLVFVTLPVVFTEIPAGIVVAFVFFLLLTFAALTSSIVLLSPTTAKLEEWGLSRPVSAWVMASIVLVLSSLTVLSFSSWKEVYPLAFVGLDGHTWFDLIREGVNNIILPLGGLAFALMVGWGLPRDRVVQTLSLESGALFQILYALIRFVVPVAIIALFVGVLFGT